MGRSRAPEIIITCMDPRIQDTIQRFIQEKDLARRHFLLSLGGGQKKVNDPISSAHVLHDIELARREGAKAVNIFAHEDCLAYGGTKLFGNVKDELDHYRRELMQAVSIIKSRFSDLTTRTFMIVRAAEDSWQLEDCD